MPSSTDSSAANRDKLSCIILAGGRGSRLGNQDKGLLSANGKTLIEHVIANVAISVDDIVISANRNHDRYRQYAPCVIADENAIAYQGPLAGIASCLPHCQHERVLVTSCDTPVLPATLASRLLSKLQDNAISVCEVNGRLQSVFIMRQRCLDSILAALTAGQLGLLRWLKTQPHAVVGFDESASAFLNINTGIELDNFSRLA